MKIKELLYDYMEKHRENLNKLEELAEFVQDFFCDEIKPYDNEVYHEFKEELDDFTFEIDKDVVEVAVEHLKRKDGKTGVKWSMADTDSVGKQYNVFVNHPELDSCIWFFSMNYAYAMHYDSVYALADYIRLGIDEAFAENVCITSIIKKIYKKYSE